MILLFVFQSGFYLAGDLYILGDGTPFAIPSRFLDDVEAVSSFHNRCLCTLRLNAENMLVGRPFSRIPNGAFQARLCRRVQGYGTSRNIPTGGTCFIVTCRAEWCRYGTGGNSAITLEWNPGLGSTSSRLAIQSGTDEYGVPGLRRGRTCWVGPAQRSRPTDGGLGDSQRCRR